jgi:nucleosome assembly protein 1-like 1
MVRKAHPVESFFNFFDPPVPLTEEMIVKDGITDEQIEEIEEKLEMDYQIGEDLKEKASPVSLPSVVAH